MEHLLIPKPQNRLFANESRNNIWPFFKWHIQCDCWVTVSVWLHHGNYVGNSFWREIVNHWIDQSHKKVLHFVLHWLSSTSSASKEKRPLLADKWGHLLLITYQMMINNVYFEGNKQMNKISWMVINLLIDDGVDVTIKTKQCKDNGTLLLKKEMIFIQYLM